MSNDKILALDQKLSAQRNEWSKTIKDLAQGLKKFKWNGRNNRKRFIF